MPAQSASNIDPTPRIPESPPSRPARIIAPRFDAAKATTDIKSAVCFVIGYLLDRNPQRIQPLTRCVQQDWRVSAKRQVHRLATWELDYLGWSIRRRLRLLVLNGPSNLASGQDALS